MPLQPGSSKAVKAANFHEFRHGPTYRHTRRKFGKKTANKQLAAAVLSNAERHPTPSKNPALDGLVSHPGLRRPKKVAAVSASNY
jgi:hypothetical protein